MQAQLQLVGTKVSAAELTRQLEAANLTIDQERTKRDEAEEELRQVISYARELHWALRPEHDALLREKAEKVRPLRPVPARDQGPA